MKTHFLIPQQVPEFVRSEHPGFVEFLQAYYVWLEQYGTVPSTRLGEYLDIDTTVDSFVKYFRKSLDIYGMTSNDPSKLYLRHVKDVYTSKGTEQAIQTVLLQMFGKQASVTIPWDDVFKASDGKWQQDTAITVQLTDGDINDLLGEFVYLVDASGSKYQTVVQTITERVPDVYELVISRFTSPSSQFVSLTSLDGTVVTTPLISTIKATVVDSGTRFEVGQTFTTLGLDNSKSIIKVKSIDSAGKIKAAEIISFGYGFEEDFDLTVTNPVYPDNTAVIRLTNGYVYRYPGYYAKSNSIVGDLTYIQDSDYYQVYSYVTVIEQTVDTYSSLLKQVLHPTGTKHFGEYLVNDQFTISPSIDIAINIILKPAPLTDAFTIGDVSAFDMVKGTFANQVTLDAGDPTFNIAPAQKADGIDAGDESYRAVGKAAADTALVGDTPIEYTLAYGRDFTDTVVAATDTLTKSAAKYSEDTVEIATSGEIALNPYVWDPVVRYSLAGYVENDIEITN